MSREPYEDEILLCGTLISYLAKFTVAANREQEEQEQEQEQKGMGTLWPLMVNPLSIPLSVLHFSLPNYSPPPSVGNLEMATVRECVRPSACPQLYLHN